MDGGKVRKNDVIIYTLKNKEIIQRNQSLVIHKNVSVLLLDLCVLSLSLDFHWFSSCAQVAHEATLNLYFF